jgi:hypothetical protein
MDLGVARTAGRHASGHTMDLGVARTAGVPKSREWPFYGPRRDAHASGRSMEAAVQRAYALLLPRATTPPRHQVTTLATRWPRHHASHAMATPPRHHAATLATPWPRHGHATPRHHAKKSAFSREKPLGPRRHYHHQSQPCIARAYSKSFFAPRAFIFLSLRAERAKLSLWKGL